MSQGARRRRSRAYTRATQLPMVVLSVIWIVLFIIQLTSRPSPVLGALGTLVWLTFIADFVIKLVLTPVRGTFLKHNWITVISLLLPAVSLLRITQVAAVLANAAGGRAFMLARMLAHANRGLNALGASFHRRGAGYVAMLTLLVAALGAAGMLTFESHNPDGHGLHDYPTALWWTAMIMTTMGSDFWPETAAGRLLCLVLALYAFSMFGYVTAALATFFVGRDKDANATSADRAMLAAIRSDIAALRADLRGPNAPERATP